MSVRHTGQGVYEVDSHTTSGVIYGVVPSMPECSCVGFGIRGGCSHLEDVAVFLGEKTTGIEKVEGLEIDLATSSWRQFKEEMGVPVRITLGKPKFFVPYAYEEARLIAPLPQVFRMSDDADFIYAYGQQIARNWDRIVVQLEGIARRHPAQTLVLLCFEDVLAGQLCHRRMFADKWKQETGNDVRELDPAQYGEPERTEKRDDGMQPGLF